MPSPTRFLALAALFLSATAIVPPGHQGLPNQTPADITHPTPDNAAIVDTASQVDQKTAPPADTPPNAAVAPTVVTAVDGTVTNTTVADVASTSSRRRRHHQIARKFSREPGDGFGKRQAGKFEKVFDGLPADQHDASIQGTAYLTYTVVNNATYNVQGCLDWCANVKGCVFVNVYYEFNNYLLDFVFGEKSNLKCAAYGDFHTAVEKLNFGGQASYPQDGNETVPLTYITQSSGWRLDQDEVLDPETPDGYELVFGPTGGANNAPGYMGFSFLDKYDVAACALLCNGRGVDSNGGGCAYFNIWRAVVDGVPATYTCSMYYLASDESTAVNYGQGSLVVTLSRGYARKSALIDGGFEGYTACGDFCFAESYANWIGTSPSNGTLDASIFFSPTYAHTGHGSALLGNAFGEDPEAGTLTPAQPLKTDNGANYVVQCFIWSGYSGETLEAPAKVDILWNGERVGGSSGYTKDYTFVEAPVVATGNDKLAFVGGSAPAWTFIDDCKVYKA
ncbi:hypothetical protein DFH08DRAFT_275865 [Mycena albidolilacea]|uniref:Fruit-body specific protein a n=1 Tax=Mycena albidolilacea TaxID=1033008 RepID=A0AAD7F1W3_9AGAR|nr:hypothetical protein DFH08DRAFT_275865 [Mycena albidolilacea]